MHVRNIVAPRVEMRLNSDQLRFQKISNLANPASMTHNRVGEIVHDWQNYQ